MLSKPQIMIGVILIVFLFTSVQSTIWDNIFSQTDASHPINLTQSFNIEFQLPKQYDLDGNFDFNSQLKTLTLKLSKTILIQKIDVIKAQVDLQKLELNTDQFLLGCEKFTMGIQDDTNTKIQQKVKNVGVSKRSLYMVNLLFKYIGRYDLNKAQNDKSNKNTKKNEPSSIFDMFKDNKIFDQLQQALGVDLKDKIAESMKGVQFYDMFEFAITDLLPKNPKDIVNKLQKGKESVKDKLDMEDDAFQGIDLQSIDLDMLKFVILTNPKTGQIIKVYKNRELKQEMQFRLQSLQKKKLECNKQAKKLTLDDLTNGAKYLYDNKDTLGNVLN